MLKICNFRIFSTIYLAQQFCKSLSQAPTTRHNTPPNRNSNIWRKQIRRIKFVRIKVLLTFPRPSYHHQPSNKLCCVFTAPRFASFFFACLFRTAPKRKDVDKYLCFVAERLNAKSDHFKNEAIVVWNQSELSKTFKYYFSFTSFADFTILWLRELLA